MKHLTLVSFISVLVGACGSDHESMEESPTARVEVVELAREPVGEGYEASGTLRGEQTAVLTAKATGYLKTIEVEPGDSVRAGSVLATLDAPELEARLRAAESAREEVGQAELEADAAVRAARAQAKIANTTYERFRGLHEKRAVTEQELDEVEARHAAADAQLALAEASAGRARSAKARAEAETLAAHTLWSYTRIRAPFDGRVLERRLDLGNLAAPGAELFVIEKEGALRAEVSVGESLAGRIQRGDSAQVWVASNPSPYDGAVVEIDNNVDTRTRSFLVKVALPANVDGALVPGSFARVRFLVGESDKLLVPATAVVTRGQLSMVYVVEGGRARLRLVTLGPSHGDTIEVLSGLSAGDQVVSSPAPDLVEDVRIEALS